MSWLYSQYLTFHWKLLVLVRRIEKSGTGDNNLANGKGHFGPTDRNDQTGHSGPPSKLVPNIPVGPNRNGPFHLTNQPKFPDFWVGWKAPEIYPADNAIHRLNNPCLVLTALCACYRYTMYSKKPLPGVDRRLDVIACRRQQRGYIVPIYI